MYKASSFGHGLQEGLLERTWKNRRAIFTFARNLSRSIGIYTHRIGTSLVFLWRGLLNPSIEKRWLRLPSLNYVDRILRILEQHLMHAIMVCNSWFVFLSPQVFIVCLNYNYNYNMQIYFKLHRFSASSHSSNPRSYCSTWPAVSGSTNCRWIQRGSILPGNWWFCSWAWLHR